FSYSFLDEEFNDQYLDEQRTRLHIFLAQGASSQAMPLVNNFAPRYEAYLNFLREKKFDERFIMESEEFHVKVQSHLSFDTFFKKLFHLSEDALITKYKYLLLLYFIYEHVTQVRLFNSYAWNIAGAEKHYFTDPRYDALIAGLLKPMKGK